MDIRGDQAVAWSIAAIAQKKSGWLAKNMRVAFNQDHPKGRTRNRSPLNRKEAKRSMSQRLLIVDRKKT